MTARVLIVSYYFPPDGGPGTQRALKFAKNLFRYGWSTSVLTRAEPQQRGRWDPVDVSLNSEIHAHVDVHRVESVNRATSWAKSLPVLDTQATHAWAEAAFEEAARIVKEDWIDLVFITMSPFDLVHLGRRLQTQLHVPVIYDLRDPWALDGWRLHRTPTKLETDFQCMQLAMAQADGVVANTSEARAAIHEAFATPNLNESTLVTITNGYDESDFDRSPIGAYQRQPKAFVLAHTGSLHDRRVESEQGLIGSLRKRRRFSHESIDPMGRSLGPLLDAVGRLQQRKHPLVSRLKIVLAGVPDEASKRTVRRSGLQDMVQWVGYLPHRESIALLQHADALFLPLHDLEAGSRSLIVPGKTYEYLATGRPILGCLPQGDARLMVEASPYGLCADPCDAKDIARQLMTMYDAWAQGRLDEPAPPSWISRFERSQLSAQLAEYLDQMIGRVKRRAPLPRAA
ncbi:MAG: glycosyltransferase [Planctomycetota bacterium]|nr:glycosyltransferase [Planctomycetota bacterium]